jgi:hypothetical protein
MLKTPCLWAGQMENCLLPKCWLLWKLTSGEETIIGVKERTALLTVCTWQHWAKLLWRKCGLLVLCLSARVVVAQSVVTLTRSCQHSILVCNGCLHVLPELGSPLMAAFQNWTAACQAYLPSGLCDPSSDWKHIHVLSPTHGSWDFLTKKCRVGILNPWQHFLTMTWGCILSRSVASGVRGPFLGCSFLVSHGGWPVSLVSQTSGLMGAVQGPGPGIA